MIPIKYRESHQNVDAALGDADALLQALFLTADALDAKQPVMSLIVAIERVMKDARTAQDLAWEAISAISFPEVPA